MLKKIGTVNLEKRPVICTVFQSPPSSSVLKKLHTLGIGLTELRIDQFPNQNVQILKQTIHRLKQKGFGVIVTIRMKKEGGSWKGSESERLKLFEEILPVADAVDIELQSKICKAVVSLAHSKKKSAIVSYHDFKKTPSDSELLSYVKQAKKERADIVKIAAFAQSKKDFYALMKFTLAHRSDSIISIAMGKFGQPSRVLFPLLGSLVTYGYVGRESAPGQLPAEKLAKAFRSS